VSPFARELFARLLVASSVYWDVGTSQFHEHTDEELDALVKYAMRAEAACWREDARAAADRQTRRMPSPTPTGVPR